MNYNHETARDIHCGNAGKRQKAKGWSCRFVSHFQQGGGHSDYSYVYCTYPETGQKVKVEPKRAGGTKKIEKFLIPKSCCLKKGGNDYEN